MTFPILSQEKRMKRLNYPKGKIRAVIDTDTFNETDDQFSIVYALLSEKIDLEAFYAAPFHNNLSSGPKDGMEKSYHELGKILTLMQIENIPVYKGSETYLPSEELPVESGAAMDLVQRALSSSDDNPLYVIAIGAITNIASALLIEPKIINKIVVLWLGGHALHWPHTKEFNLCQDLHASRIIFNSGVPLILFPCEGVSSHLITSLSELRDHMKNYGKIGSYLYDTFKRYQKHVLDDEKHTIGYSKVIWDLAPIGYLNNEEWASSYLTQSPVLSEDFRWSFDVNRHFIRYIYHVNRDGIFRDLFNKFIV